MRATRRPYVRSNVRPLAGPRDPIQVLRARCRRKFLAYFPEGFDDPEYVATERGYKAAAHERWTEELGRAEHRRLIDERRFAEVAERAVKIEGRTHLLFSFEKMALRDGVRTRAGAERFAVELYERLYGRSGPQRRFEAFTDALDGLPRRQSRVLTWPVHTVWGFLADPAEHFYLKPRVVQTAARAYGFDFQYRARPNWETYQSALAFAEQVRADTADLGPKDMIDLQSFIWVMGSDEYPS